jgi:hypothetical protein
MASGNKHRNHYSVEINPARLDMHEQHGVYGIAWANIYVGDT